MEFVVPLTFLLHFQYMKAPIPTATITTMIAAPTDRATVWNMKPWECQAAKMIICCNSLPIVGVLSSPWASSITTGGVVSALVLVVGMLSELFTEVGHSTCRRNNTQYINLVMRSLSSWLTNFDFSGWGHSCTIPSTNVYTNTTHVHILGQINCIMESWLMIVFYSCCINSSTRVHHSNNKILWCPGFAWLRYL